MDHPFAAIRQTKLSEDIVAQIKALIKDGQLKPGDKLPSERQLARILEVGRSSLREAVNSLATMGLVEVRRRKGIYVGNVSTPLITDPLRRLMTGGRKIFADLYDIRIDIEVAAAAAAAENRTDAHLRAIGDSLKAIRNLKGRNFYETDHDLNFHLAIAEASDNFLRVHIIKEIFDLAGSHIDHALQRITSRQEHINTICRQHGAILDAITQRDGKKAGAVMQAHLLWVKSLLRTFL